VKLKIDGDFLAALLAGVKKANKVNDKVVLYPCATANGASLIVEPEIEPEGVKTQHVLMGIDQDWGD
jgi:hypothetical protein